MSARDILRRTRGEQKRKQLQKDGAREDVLAAIVKAEPLLRLEATGELHCNLCHTQVKPAHAVGWNVHRRSRRHLNCLYQSKQPGQSPGVKRSRGEEVVGSDVSDSLADRLKIDQSDGGGEVDQQDVYNGGVDQQDADNGGVDQQGVQAKRRRISELAAYASESGSSSEEAGGSGSEAGGSGSEAGSSGSEAGGSGSEAALVAAAGGVPAGFFDEGVAPATAAADSDHDASGSADEEGTVEPFRAAATPQTIPTNMDDVSPAELPNDFFDNAGERVAAMSGVTLAKVEADRGRRLQQSLAAFESEIADLTEASTVMHAKEDRGREDERLSGELVDQGADWESRTRHLLQLHTIVEEGMRSMDPREDDHFMDSDSSDGSDSGSEFRQFTDWRSGQL